MFRVSNLNDVIFKRTNFLNCFYQQGKKLTTQQLKLDLSKFNSGLAFLLRLFAFALSLTVRFDGKRATKTMSEGTVPIERLCFYFVNMSSDDPKASLVSKP